MPDLLGRRVGRVRPDTARGRLSQRTTIGESAATAIAARVTPHVGPDADRVYVWAGSEGLLSMRYDGTDIKTIVKVTAPAPPALPGAPPGPPPSPDEVILSPDGKRALVRANRNVYMVTVP